MELQSAVFGKNLVIRVQGVLDVMTADDFRRRIQVAMEQTGARHLFLNLAGVAFIDSSGLGVILGRYRQITHAGGRMGLIDVPPQLLPTVTMGGLLRLMPVMASESEIQAG